MKYEQPTNTRGILPMMCLVLILGLASVDSARAAPKKVGQCDTSKLTAAQVEKLRETKRECEAIGGTFSVDSSCSATCKTLGNQTCEMSFIGKTTKLGYVCYGVWNITIADSGPSMGVVASVIKELAGSLQSLDAEVHALERSSKGRVCPGCSRLVMEASALKQRTRGRLTLAQAQQLQAQLDGLTRRIRRQMTALQGTSPIVATPPTSMRAVTPSQPPSEPVPPQTPPPAPMPIPPGGPKLAPVRSAPSAPGMTSSPGSSVAREQDPNVKRCKEQGGTWIVEWQGNKPIGVCYGGKGEGKLFECRSQLECRTLGGDPPPVKAVQPPRPGTPSGIETSPSLGTPSTENLRAVPLRETGTPNLRVSRLEYVTGEMRFRVHNVGTAQKAPGEVRYRMQVHYTDGQQVHEGVAGMTSLARIAAGGEGPEDRAAGYSVNPAKLVSVEFCINPDRRVEESDYTDNCRTFSAQALRWDVTVRLDRIRAHKDGDSVSPGDWQVYLAAKGRSGSAKRARWPGSGTKNVDSGTTVVIGREVRLSGVGAGEELELEIGVVDCDSGGTFSLGDLVPHLALLTRAFGRSTGTCGGEEVFEASGEHDAAGTSVSLPPAEWKRGGERAYRVQGSGLDYTAYVQLRVEAY